MFQCLFVMWRIACGITALNGMFHFISSQSTALLVVESQHKCFGISQTIESLSQPGLLYSGLPNNTDRQTDDRSGDLLLKMAAQAKAQAEAEAATQGDESAVEINEARIAMVDL